MMGLSPNPFKRRKHQIYDAFLRDGIEGAVALNVRLPEPVKDTTLRTWCSTWRHNPPADQPSSPKLTVALRAAAIRSSGAVRQPGRAELYKLPDGRKVKLRTNADGGLMTKANNLFDAHRIDAVLIAIPKTRRSLADGIEVYCVPANIARTALAKGREAWLASGPDTSVENDLDVINFYPRPEWLPELTDFSTKWAAYRLPEVAGPPAAEPLIRLVPPGGVRALVDGELLSAPDADGLVTILRLNVRFCEPAPDNAVYMRESAERARIMPGAAIRTGSARHFIADLHAANMIELIKREIVLETEGLS